MPIDTSFAVRGMGNSFSEDPVIDRISPISLPINRSCTRQLSLDNSYHMFMQKAKPASFQHHTTTLKSNNAHTRSLERPEGRHQRKTAAEALQEPAVPPAGQAAIHVPSLVCPEEHKAKLYPTLSNAPQTKVEQQRSALQKLSRAISSSSAPIDLEDLFLRILHQATEPTKLDSSVHHVQDDKDAVTLTRSEALKASQAISNLIKQSPSSVYRLQRRSTQGYMSNGKVCPICQYTVARECDLRKHMKRHNKPYGCTYPKCYRRFGAKSDWKRHENSQHYQHEAFRCAQRSASGALCGQHYVRQSQFEEHLTTQHKLPPSTPVQEEVARCKIGRNCQEQFWCGFCNVVLELRESRNVAWAERFDHIAQHLEKEKKSIDDWICVELNKKKGELAKKARQYVFEEDDDKTSEDDDDSPSPVNGSGMTPQSGPSQTSPAQDLQHTNKRKRHASEDLQSQAKRQMVNRYCVSIQSVN